MGTPGDDPGRDIGLGAPGESRVPRVDPAEGAGRSQRDWRIIAATVAAIAALVGSFALGRSGTGAAPSVPPEALADRTAPPTPTTPPPTLPPTPTAPPEPSIVESLGQGVVLAELDLGNRSRAVLWCRETVPGTSIGSTLALLHIGDSIRFGEQLILYEELTKPLVVRGAGRRGVVLETEGLGAGNFAAPVPETETEDVGPVPGDGSRCQSCGPERVQLSELDEVLIGSCIHGVPFGSSIAYVVARPTWKGQTPLALHAACGVTTLSFDGGGFVLEAMAPPLPGLTSARFFHPPVRLQRNRGWFEADDLQLLDWHCEVARSSQLDDLHTLPERPRLRVEAASSRIGEIGLHPPVVVGRSQEQCSALTRAWWDRPNDELGTGSPIADLIGLDPPEGQRDWFYACQPER